MIGLVLVKEDRLAGLQGNATDLIQPESIRILAMQCIDINAIIDAGFCSNAFFRWYYSC